MPSLDLLVYHDFTDNRNESLPIVGTSAQEWLGDAYEGLFVAAVSAPIHRSKDATVVLAHHPDGMLRMQQRLDGAL